MPKSKPNPIYPRWEDPFTGMSTEDIIRAGDGDFDRGYDKILDSFIASWNACAAKNKYLPPTSREHGLEWEIDVQKVAEEALRIRRREVAEIKAARAKQEAEALRR